jgi:hypothetical protein
VSFTREYPVKAVRKRHRCECCRSFIEIGEPATRWAGMSDGDFYSVIMHPDCRAAEVELNDLKDWRSGDDWWPLHEAEPDDHQWLLEEYPIVSARLGITATEAMTQEVEG